MEKWWNEICVGENGRNPEKNLPRPRFVHHETHMQRPRRELGTPAVGGERLTACATRPPPHTHTGTNGYISKGAEILIIGLLVNFENT